MVEEGKLKALFGLFDVTSLARVSQSDFTRVVLQGCPVVSVVERLKNKVKKGGERLLRVLQEEFQNADIPYGCVGQLPISNFQTIMIDYDLPMVDSDLKLMRNKAIVVKDNEGNEYVRYRELMTEV